MTRNQDNNQAREIKITPSVNPYAEGSVQVNFGNTLVLVTASISEDTPRWLKNSSGETDRGWITAEYGMLPRSTHTRNKREAASGKQGGRTLEIQRLIGRAMRASIEDKKIPGALITLDCDVVVADGGTRTASISGAWVALCQALNTYAKTNKFKTPLEIRQIAAISAGSVGGNLLVDLCYEEDSNAEFDCNIALDSDYGIVEIQGTAEKKSLPFKEIEALYTDSLPTIKHIMALQSECVQDLEFIKVK